VSAPVVDPGPPPPLPADLIVPPRPPLPAAAEPGAPAADPTPPDVAVEESRTAEPAPAVDDELEVDAPTADDTPVAEEPVADDPATREAAGANAAAASETSATVSEVAEPSREERVESVAPVDPVVVDPEADQVAPGESAAVDSRDEGEGEAAAGTVDPETVDTRAEEAAADDAAADGEPEEAIVGSNEHEPVATAPDSRADTTAADAPDVPALRLRNITKNFGELRAVDGVDLTVPAGSFYGLVGPNGAGKTTTLSIIAGLLRSDGGTVEINGLDASRASRAAKKLIGVLPDRLRTFDRLTGRQLLSYYGALRGLPSPVVESRAADLARAFDLVDALGRPVSDYSAGMTKKVMLAGAMIHSPRLLVLDEPFEAVDPVSSAVILDILRAYVEHGGTVILSSHGMELVERVCSRVAVIVSGQVLAEGTVDEVRGESTLEQRFLELSGGLGDVEGLEWLHTFSA
jgi:ABC-2 type transport system ATP-binding protein